MTKFVPSNNSSILWLRRAKNEQADQQLHELIDHIKLFHELEECENYIRETIDDRLILIVDSQFSQELISRIHDLSQLLSIYIHGVTTAEDNEWTKNFTKVIIFLTFVQINSEDHVRCLFRYEK